VSVRLRLTRVGSRKNPVWRVVVADQRSPRDGRVLETVGRYNPQREPSEIVLNRERVDLWLARGAQPSGTVRKLIRATERGAPPASTSAAPAAAVAAPAAAEAGDASATEATPAPGESDEVAPSDASAPAVDETVAAEHPAE
jgi:small subunit ribosomal protein S16